MTTEEKIMHHRKALKILQDIERLDKRQYLTSNIDEGYCIEKRSELEEKYNGIIEAITENVY